MTKPKANPWLFPVGSPGYVMLEKRTKPEVARLPPIARALLDVVLSEMNSAGHAALGSEALVELVTELRGETGSGAVRGALDKLKAAQIVTPDSSAARCIVVYAHIAQQGSGAGYCSIHGNVARAWLLGTRPSFKLAPLPKIKLDPDEVITSVSMAHRYTGELREAQV